MNTLPSKIHNYNNGLDYTLVGNYYLPELKPFEAPPLGKYGRMRLRYLKEHRPCTYTALLLSGKLYDDLHDADETAQRMLDQLIPQMAKDAGVTEEMKASDPMRWIGMMNTIKAQVEEIIFDEVGTVKYYAQIHLQVWQNSVCTGQGNLPLIT